jgi:hypothetical protein
MARIIVSYRRSDTASTAGRMFDRLAAHYGDEHVFMDVDKIPFGTDFRKHIQEVLRGADIVLAVIGPSWLGTTGEDAARIHDAADPVRVEIETALRLGVTLIPVLVDDATMPAAAALPESMRDFAYLNAAPVDVGRDFRAHMERLIRSMDAMLASRGKAAAGAASPKAAAGSRAVLAAGGVAALLLIGAGIAFAPALFGPREAEKKATAPADAKGSSAEQAKNTLGRIGEPPAPATPLQEPPSQRTAAPPATYRVLPNVSDGIQNVRSGPAVKYPLVISIPAGAGGIVLGACRPAEDMTRPWCEATWRKYKGWISSCCIVDEQTGAPPRLDQRP